MKEFFIKYKWFIICLFFLITAGLCLAYQKQRQEEAYSIICIPKVYEPNNDFWNILLEGAQMAAEEYGVSLEIIAAPTEDDYETQNAIILEAIEKKPDAILLAAADYEKTQEAARLIKENGIRLVIIDSGVSGNLADTQISTDNIQAGIKLGAVAKTLIKGEGKIGIISFVQGTLTAIDRENGFRIALNDAEDRIVEVFYCNSDYDKAYEGTVQMLNNHPDITVIAGLNQYSAVGAARAIRDLGLTGRVKLVGIDSSIEQIQYLESGIYECIVIQKPFSIGYLGVEKAVQLLENQYVAVKYDSGSVLITRDNMYMGMNQKLLFPFLEGMSTSP